MSMKLKALAALNVFGWVIAVPVLLFALVSPFVDFDGWPRTIAGGLGDGTITLREDPRAETRGAGGGGGGGGGVRATTAPAR